MTRGIFFHHIQKTAGMSLHAAFESEYGADAVSVQIYGLTVDQALAKYADKRVIAGHMVATPGTRVPAGYYSVTLLRDPVERFISHLFFNLRELDIEPPARPISARWWDEIIARERDGALSIGNWQTESLYRYAVADDRHIDPPSKLEAAKAALMQFSLVGTVEEFRESILVMALDCGWRTIPALAFDNPTSSRPSRDEIDGRIIAQIAGLNTLDAALWESARGLFHRARERALEHAVAIQSGLGGPDAEPVSPPQALPSSSRARTGEQAIADSMRREMGSREAELVTWELRPQGGVLTAGMPVEIAFSIRCNSACEDLTLGIRIADDADDTVYGSNSRLLGFRLSGRAGDVFSATWHFALRLPAGSYRVLAALHPQASHDAKCYHLVDPVGTLVVPQPSQATFEGRVDLHPRLLIESEGGTIDRAFIEAAPAHDAPLTDFRASLRVASPAGPIRAGRIALTQIEITNLGSETWPCAGAYPVCLSYHWLDEDSAVVEFEGLRSELPHDVLPGMSLVVRARACAPRNARARVLRWTLVQERVAWFEEREPSCAVTQPIAVEA